MWTATCTYVYMSVCVCAGWEAQWLARTITLVIKTCNPRVGVSKRNTHSLRRYYCASEQFIAVNNCATTTNIPVPSNRAIRYSGRTYGNVYRQANRSRIVNNNLWQYNHTRYYVMNIYRGPCANFAISAQKGLVVWNSYRMTSIVVVLRHWYISVGSNSLVNFKSIPTKRYFNLKRYLFRAWYKGQILKYIQFSNETLFKEFKHPSYK